jgi:hypothetical protein
MGRRMKVSDRLKGTPSGGQARLHKARPFAAAGAAPAVRHAVLVSMIHLSFPPNRPEPPRFARRRGIACRMTSRIYEGGVWLASFGDCR